MMLNAGPFPRAKPVGTTEDAILRIVVVIDVKRF